MVPKAWDRQGLREVGATGLEHSLELPTLLRIPKQREAKAGKPQTVDSCRGRVKQRRFHVQHRMRQIMAGAA